MECSIKFDTDKPGGAHTNMFLSLKVDFVLENSADPDEMAPYVSLHLGLHCLS